MVYSQLVTALFGGFLGAYLGAADYGVVNLTRTVFVVVLVVTPLGLDLALQRSFSSDGASALTAAGEVNWLRGFSVAFAAAISLFLLAGGASTLEASVFRYHGFGGALAVTMLALPFATDTAVLGGAYRGLRRPSANLIATYVIQPTARIALVLLLFLVLDRVMAAIVGMTLSFVFAGLWMVAVARREFPLRTLRAAGAWTRARSVLAYSPVLGLSMLVFTFARSLDTLTLAHFSPSAEVGRYAVVLMVGQLVGIIGSSLGQTLGSRVAATAFSGDHARVAEILHENMSLSSILCAPFCVAIALWGKDVDLLLGKSYVIAAPVFVVASVTQWMMTTTHNASTALSLTGRHRIELYNNLTALAVQAIACFSLIPAFGMLGAAASTTLSIFVVNALRQVQIKTIFGTRVFRLRLLWPLAISAAVAIPWYGLGIAFGFRAWWLTGLVAVAQISTSFALIIAIVVSPGQRRDLFNMVARRAHG